jgi:spermidine synthase
MTSSTSGTLRVRVDDGRNFLLLWGERFDVITADVIQPSHAGAGNVHSREDFQLVRRALKDRGLALRWIGAPARSVSEDHPDVSRRVPACYVVVRRHPDGWLGRAATGRSEVARVEA